MRQRRRPGRIPDGVPFEGIQPQFLQSSRGNDTVVISTEVCRAPEWPTADASPSGIAVGADGAIYMAALRGRSLWRIPLDSKGKAGKPQRLLQAEYGRLRTVVPAPDGRLWLVTSNTFRGTPNPGDDRILALRLPVQ